MPAAASTAAPSSRTRVVRPSMPSPRCSRPTSASRALTRLLRSLRYFQRMTSARGSDENVDDENAPAITTAVSSSPDGAASDVEDAGGGRGVGHDHAGLEVHRRAAPRTPRRRSGTDAVPRARSRHRSADTRSACRRAGPHRARRARRRCPGLSRRGARRRRRGSRRPPARRAPAAATSPTRRGPRAATRGRGSRRGARRGPRARPRARAGASAHRRRHRLLPRRSPQIAFPHSCTPGSARSQPGAGTLGA